MSEILTWLDHGDPDAHPIVRAAMAHLHLVSVHPFRDGNGRISRILQSLVLAAEGSWRRSSSRSRSIWAQHRCVLRDAPDGPGRDLSARARRDPLGSVLRRRAHRAGSPAAEAALRRGNTLDVSRGARAAAGMARPSRDRARAEPLPEDGQGRLRYRGRDIAPTASGDLRRLLDAGLIVQEGRGRITRYAASDGLRRDVRLHLDLGGYMDGCSIASRQMPSRTRYVRLLGVRAPTLFHRDRFFFRARGRVFDRRDAFDRHHRLHRRSCSSL